MQSIALTGLSSQVLRNLQENHIKTIEIRSPHNFISVNVTNVGDFVFLTRTSISDITNGTIGLIARITQRQIAIQRVMQHTADIFEEYEIFTARLQVELQGMGRVRKVGDIMVGKPCLVEVDRVTYLEAK